MPRFLYITHLQPDYYEYLFTDCLLLEIVIIFSILRRFLLLKVEKYVMQENRKFNAGWRLSLADAPWRSTKPEHSWTIVDLGLCDESKWPLLGCYTTAARSVDHWNVHHARPSRSPHGPNDSPAENKGTLINPSLRVLCLTASGREERRDVRHEDVHSFVEDPGDLCVFKARCFLGWLSDAL